MMRKTTLYMDAETMRRLKILAAERGTTMTELIRGAIERLLEEAGAKAAGRRAK